MTGAYFTNRLVKKEQSRWLIRTELADATTDLSEQRVSPATILKRSHIFLLIIYQYSSPNLFVYRELYFLKTHQLLLTEDRLTLIYSSTAVARVQGINSLKKQPQK